MSKSVPHEGCRELGIISGSGGGGGYTSSKSKLNNAQTELRNEAASMGGDVAVMDVVASDIRGVTINGRAFDCSSGRPNRPTPVTVIAGEPPRDKAMSSGDEVAAAPKPAETDTSKTETPSSDEDIAKPESEPQRSVEERLELLSDLKAKGLLSNDEYEARRAAILESI